MIGRIEMPDRFYFKVSQAAQYLGTDLGLGVESCSTYSQRRMEWSPE